MALTSSLIPFQTTTLTYVSDDFYDYGYKLFSPDEPIEQGFVAVYVFDVVLKLVSAALVSLTSDGLVRLPHEESLEAASEIRCLFDYGSTSIDFVDRTHDDVLELHTTFTVTNTSQAVACVDVVVVSKDIDYHVSRDPALRRSNVKYTSGEPSPSLNLSSDLFTGLVPADFIVLHNSSYAGLLGNTVGYLVGGFTSEKRGKVEVVKTGKFQFAVPGSSSWSNAYQLNRLSPGESVTVALRCRVTFTSRDRYMNGVLLLAKEELT